MLTVREAYQRTRDALRTIYDPGEAGAVADLVFERTFHIPHKEIMLNGDAFFLHEPERMHIVERLLKFEPVQHITGFEVFRGLRILLDRHVLIPRPETEELLEWICAEETESPGIVADLCTGSGCIALALRKHFPDADVFAADLSADALRKAAESELENFESASIHWIQNDLLLEPLNIPEPDLLVCNPPYIMFSERASMAGNVLEYEPHTALFVYDPDPLLFYKRVINLFGKNGRTRIYFELNPLTAGDLKAWCSAVGLNCVIRKDMSDLERFARITA